MADDVHISGLAELQKFLDQLPAKMERNVVRGGLRAGMQVVRAVAQQSVPVRYGALRASLDAKRALRTGSRGGVVTATVKTKVFYAKFVEYGTKPHTITAKDGGALAIGGGYYKSVKHPGIVNPKPFMRPALDSQAHAAAIAVGEYIKNRLATKHGLDTADVTIGEEAE